MNHKLIQLSLEKSIGSKMDEYAAFVNSAMNNAQFRKCANSLLPFDGVVHSDIPFPDEGMAMGISIMRMDMETDTFALGITLEMDTMPGIEKNFQCNNIYLGSPNF